MRSFVFSIAYWFLSVTYGLSAAIATLVPGRKATGWVIRRYVKRMVQAMRLLAGITVQVRGRQHIPTGAFIVASKHQSWGDGFATYDQFGDLAFVAGDNLEKIPLLGPVLDKLGAIIVNNCGGRAARTELKTRGAEAHAAGRKILIFPEGHLAKTGEKFRYRSGVWHMYRDFNMPVLPLASNLGVFWPEQTYEKRPGVATLEFLDLIPTGLPKAEFMARLEAVVEAKTAELIAEAKGGPVVPNLLVPAPDEVARTKKNALD
ncbi:1-acyl-sn-glycerol-3-phosphate acyltransferase [soil metagenome]